MAEEIKNEVMQEYLTLEQYPAIIDFTFFELLKQRKIVINEEIDDNLVEKVIMQIIKINEQDKDIPPAKRKPIEIYINSNGGMVDIGMVLCDVIKYSKTPIHGIVLGRAYSMGGLILLACHKRIAYPYSSVLLHDGSLGLVSSSKKAKDTMKFYDELEERTKKFILENSKISEEKYEEMYGSEWFVFADQAKELGIIDEIVGE